MFLIIKISTSIIIEYKMQMKNTKIFRMHEFQQQYLFDYTHSVVKK